ncbi:CotY/CotZ family spore coat protein [Lentibacillus kapialis]|uniref:CotY/CotZ family spore coat protein n=1 Tax=Lentibacillus kapialis TaxID=340214 RepID=UPI001666DB7D|nr:CotY/CotZ family spore coat protein [Lentibacillus kapialis]
MSCHKGRENVYSKRRDDSCVCDIVRNIIKAQDEVADMSCHTSCDRSIHQLLSHRNDTGPQNTTIPFILYCKGDCDPFVGSGVSRSSAYGKSFFECVETPIFRAKKFVHDKDCCVKLELLLPVSESCEVVKPYDKHGKVCQFFSTDKPITDFVETGICLTVDLEDFTGITCLDPVSPLSINEMHVPDNHAHKHY